MFEYRIVLYLARTYFNIPKPLTTLRTPAGIPASSERAHAYKADNGVCSAIKFKYIDKYQSIM